MIFMGFSIIGKHDFQYRQILFGVSLSLLHPFSSFIFSLIFFLNVCLTTPFVFLNMQSWDWTSDHLVRQICEYLESRLMEGSSAAIIVLLGQLGRYCLLQIFPYALLNMKMMTACCHAVGWLR